MACYPPYNHYSNSGYNPYQHHAPNYSSQHHAPNYPSQHPGAPNYPSHPYQYPGYNPYQQNPQQTNTIEQPDTSKSIQPGQPVQPVQPGQLGQHVQPVQPIQPGQPAQKSYPIQSPQYQSNNIGNIIVFEDNTTEYQLEAVPVGTHYTACAKTSIEIKLYPPLGTTINGKPSYTFKNRTPYQTMLTMILINPTTWFMHTS